VTTVWVAGELATIVGMILLATRRPVSQPLFRWLPVPLWCYALPIAAVALGWLPRHDPAYRSLTESLLPVALGLLLLGTDLPAVIRSGSQALLAMIIGSAGVMVGAPLGVWLLRTHLPPDAWKGAGSLAATWTGGTMNLLALRSVFETPDRIFAPLIIVDALTAYSWMALLVALSGAQGPINRWLGASNVTRASASQISGASSATRSPWASRLGCALLILVLVGTMRVLAEHLPLTRLVSSTSGWTVLLVTTVTLLLSLLPRVRHLGCYGSQLGYPCLYVVLAATGAQASLEALWAAPTWLLVGVITVLVHGLVLVSAGRFFRWPLGMLATVSQADIGGVVSAPLVGAVYHQDLVPVGLLLAVAANAVGTYLGLLSALLAHVMIGH